MFDHDADPFGDLLEDVWSLWPSAKPLGDGQATMFFRALAAYPIEVVRRGLDAHVKDPVRGRFAPVPADVIAQIEERASDDGRPGPEEAWAIAGAGVDEKLTIVWTTEIAAAWGIARPLMQLGDEVAARMAFREAYMRLVDAARGINRAVHWSAALGHDPKERDRAIEHAVALGRLPPPQVPLLEGTETDAEAARRAGDGLVGGLDELLARAPDWVLERLNGTRDRLLGKAPVPETHDHVPEHIRRANEAKERAAAAVVAEIERTGLSVDEYMTKHGRMPRWRTDERSYEPVRKNGGRR